MPKDSVYEQLPAYVIAAVLVATIALVLLLSAIWGRRAAREGSAVDAGSLEAMVSGLLGLLLAFNFSFAQSRYDARQQVLVREANAIGTAFLRCSVLSNEPAGLCRDLLRRYAHLRIDAYQAYARTDVQSALDRDLTEGERLQDELWTVVSREVRTNPNVGNAQLMVAVNDVIDRDADRRASIRIAVPRAVSVAIVLVCLAWAALVGYTSAAKKRGAAFELSLLVVIPIGVVFGLALDFDRPRSGAITMDAAERAMTNLARSMESPPSP